MTQTVELLANMGASPPGRDVRALLTNMCSRCLQMLVVSQPVGVAVDMDVLEGDKAMEEDAEEQLQLENTVKGMKALLRKKLKALQSILDCNLSSSKID